MATFDIESFRDYWLDLIKINLQAKLDEITTEKGDALKLDAFPDAAWINDLNSKVMNREQFVHYSLDANDIDTNGSETSTEIVLSIEIVFSDQDGGINVENKLLRYARAMKEIALSNANENANIGDVIVKSFIPVSIQVAINGPVMKTSGIQITGTITT